MAVDCFIKDINCQKLKGEISNRLSIKYLGPVDESSTKFPQEKIQGIIYGDSNRGIIPLIVEKDGKKIYVFFLIDTHSSCTFLSQDSLYELGLSPSHPSQNIDIKINGVNTSISMSPPKNDNQISVVDQSSDINILGTEFLNKSNANLCFNFMDKKCEIEFPELEIHTPHIDNSDVIKFL
eukprot:gene9688-11889_t